MKQKILILGATGMVGHKLFCELSKQSDLDVTGTVRSVDKLVQFLSPELMAKIAPSIEANKLSTITDLLDKLKPDIVINCIGITKQLTKEDDPLETIGINSAYPHLLAHHCQKVSARMIQMTTDCVFNGKKGNYKESDPADATDLYGRTKYLGEVYYPHCLTIRTSFIGHELGKHHHGLVGWFLAQENKTKGFTKAIYTGMPTVLIAKVFVDHILPNPELNGLYQVSTEPISKYDLLALVAKTYNKPIVIAKDDSVKIDRSLNSDRFRLATGYKPLPWEKMIKIMFEDYQQSGYYRRYC